MEHSKEPWKQGRAPDGAEGDWIVSSESTPRGLDPASVRYYGGDLVAESIAPQDRRRIIACVNVLEGWSTEDLEEILARGSRIRKVAP